MDQQFVLPAGTRVELASAHSQDNGRKQLVVGFKLWFPDSNSSICLLRIIRHSLGLLREDHTRQSEREAE